MATLTQSAIVRYEQLAEQEEQSYQQLRRKLYSEVQQEKDKLASETSIVREEIGRQLKELKVRERTKTK